ncbi:MAG: aminopeptidase P N-terminal domain-containing protein [Alistipes sp.]|nr:aminopeptidase P N-terminal domain-containing protein [Alistipes sp.]
MFSKEVYERRRRILCDKVGKGLILLAGNEPSPMSYADNTFDFRQDSTFLYYFGLDLPSLAGVIDAESGRSVLFGNDAGIDDLIWTGPVPALRELAAEVGVGETRPFAELADEISAAAASGRTVHYLPPYRAETSLLLSRLLGRPAESLFEGKSADLIFAVAEMREKKEECELDELRKAYEIGFEMHTAAMKMCRAGVRENEITGVINAIPKRMGGWGLSFPSIVTQHGETLHNSPTTEPLRDGRLLLVDAGGERASHYCSDHTRTYPVNGRFTERQREIYEIVLKAHDAVPQLLRPGMMYSDLHRAACVILAEGLHDAGLILCGGEEAVEAGVMSGLFMPHGLGHGIGLDVHDCQAVGERSFDFGEYLERAAATATCIHRATWRLNPGTVLSDEPGIYFIPALIDKVRGEGRFKGLVDFAKLEGYKDFGGIRIEDDLIVTETGCEITGGGTIPSKVADLEAFLAR